MLKLVCTRQAKGILCSFILGVILMEGLKNMMEEAVEYHLNKVLPTMPNVCSCNDCKMDMATYALNRLAPQYVRTDTGALYKKLNNSTQQAEVEILTTVISAIETIGAHPHHAKKEPNTQ
jgi:competence protein ComFB